MLSNSSELLTALFYSTILTSLQLASSIGIFLIVGFVIAKLEAKRNGWIQASVGRKGIYLTALVGVPIHEIGHAIMCLVFGHRIDAIKLVQFGAEDGTMGYVNHSYEVKNLLHRIGLFFIGIAPILMGIAMITLSFWLLVPDSFAIWWDEVKDARTLVEAAGATLSIFPALFTVENLTDGWFYVFLAFAISVASHMTLSPSDIQGAKSGFIVLFLVLVVGNLFHIQSMERLDYNDLFFNGYNLFIYSVSSIAILFALVATGIGYLLFRVRTIAKK